jgi:cbb3-type cytochrome oxidase subunit 3
MLRHIIVAFALVATLGVGSATVWVAYRPHSDAEFPSKLRVEARDYAAAAKAFR